MNDQFTIEQAMLALDNTDYQQQLKAIHFLEQERYKPALPKLLALLESKETLRKGGKLLLSALAWAIGLIGDASTVPLLMDVARKADAFTHIFIATALHHLPSSAILLEMLEKGDAVARANAATMLGNLHYEAAIPQLIQTLHLDDDDNVKIEVSTALGMMRTPAVVAPLMEALRENPRIRWHIANRLGWLRDKRTVPILIETLHDEDPKARAEAAQALGIIEDSSAAQGLIEALHDSDELVRSNAAASLGALGAVEAVPALIELLQRNTDRRGFFVIVRALGKLGDRAAIPSLEALLKHPYKAVQSIAAFGLHRLGNDSGLPVLASNMSRNEDQGTRLTTALCLWEIADSRTLPILIDALHDVDEQVRQRVVEALGKIGGEESITALKGVLDDPDWYVRDIAFDALHRIERKQKKDSTS